MLREGHGEEGDDWLSLQLSDRIGKRIKQQIAADFKALRASDYIDDEASQSRGRLNLAVFRNGSDEVGARHGLHYQLPPSWNPVIRDRCSREHDFRVPGRDELASNLLRPQVLPSLKQLGESFVVETN
jgi:hypothetical protein